RVEPLEDELRSSREEVVRLTQEAAAKVERSEMEGVQQRVEALEAELRQAREELSASTSRATETARQLEEAQQELGQAVSSCQQLRTQIHTRHATDTRVEPLEDELRSSREEIVRLTQEAA